MFFSERFAQAAPKVGNKPLAQVKPKQPMGCTRRIGQGHQAVGW
jgi:hypothetical protein